MFTEPLFMQRPHNTLKVRALAPELLDLVEEALILIEGRPEHACERFEAKAKDILTRAKGEEPHD